MVSAFLDQERVVVECLKERQCRRSAFFNGGVGRQIASVRPLNQKMKRQCDHHQEHQRLYSLWIMQEYWPDGQRPFEPGIHLLAVGLLFESREQCIRAVCSLCRRDDRIVTIVLLIDSKLILIESECEPVRWTTAGSAGRWQCLRLLLRQWDHLVTEVLGGIAGGSQDPPNTT